MLLSLLSFGSFDQLLELVVIRVELGLGERLLPHVLLVDLMSDKCIMALITK